MLVQHAKLAPHVIVSTGQKAAALRRRKGQFAKVDAHALTLMIYILPNLTEVCRDVMGNNFVF